MPTVKPNIQNQDYHVGIALSSSSKFPKQSDNQPAFEFKITRVKSRQTIKSDESSRPPSSTLLASRSTVGSDDSSRPSSSTLLASRSTVGSDDSSRPSSSTLLASRPTFRNELSRQQRKRHSFAYHHGCQRQGGERRPGELLFSAAVCDAAATVPSSGTYAQAGAAEPMAKGAASTRGMQRGANI